MLASLRKMFALELTIAEWIGTGVILAVPYALLGVAYVVANGDRFAGQRGAELVLGLVGSVLAWPVLLFPNVCVG